jgi:pimeloyl-ACP methyl ester carboxylesterase
VPILEAEDLRIDYSASGTGETVVLIHSGASSNRQWRTLTEMLQDRYRVIAPNLCGAGETPAWSGLRPMRLADTARMVELICAQAGGPVNLVGHSYGGAVTMEAAARLGERVARLVLLEPAPYDLLRQHGRTAAYSEAWALYQFVKDASGRGDWRAVTERFLRAFLGDDAWEAMPEDRRKRSEQLVRQNGHEWDTLMTDRTTLRQWAERLPKRTMVISTPDTWPPLRELMSVLQSGCPHWTFSRVAAGGHMAPLTRPDLVNPLIGAFLES